MSRLRATEHLSGRAAIVVPVSHGHPQRGTDELDDDFTQVVADTMQALATPSRLRILGRLQAGPCAVSQLAAAVGMEPSAVSHQLRLLRHLGLVAGHREGRNVIYALHDDHVGQLLQEAIAHVEHLYPGGRSASATSTLSGTSA
jgi:ArsR family transcriptional regulator, nickel/cobalt-responsive transcriptional repressor